MGFALNSLEEE